MQTESSIGVTSEPSGAGAAPAAVDTSTTQDTSLAPEQTAGSATAGDVQGSVTSPDPLEGVPSLDELNQLPDETQHKKSLIQLRTAIEQQFKPQLGELTEKFKPFEPYADRFSSPEEVQQIVDLKDKLYGWERDQASGQLVPATQSFAESLAQSAPETADFLAADLMNGMTRDPETGRELTRIDLALESIATDPARKAAALKILGGVEPTSIAPTWQPTADELETVKPELQDIYKKLPFDKREALKLNPEEFINEYLEEQKFKADLMEQNRVAQERETRQQQQREQYLNTQAQDAGNKHVETQFKQGFTEFANSIVERSKFIQPIDPQSEVARQLPPEQLTAMNQEIQQINTGVGMMVSTVVAALSHPDTRFVAEAFLRSVGIDDKVIQEFDNARVEFARNSRDYGELNFRNSLGQPNGNGHAGLGVLQTNANRALQNMRGRGNLVAKPLLELMGKFFEMKANSHNQTLNGAASVRPSISGSAFDPTKAATQRPPGQSKDQIYNRADIERMAL